MSAPLSTAPLRVGFFPGSNGSTRWDREIHPWSALATDAIRAEGAEVLPISLEHLRDLPREPELDIVHLNWPQSLAEPGAFKRRKYLPPALFGPWFRGEVRKRMRALEEADVAVVWQVHDLPYDADPRRLELLEHVFGQFYSRADGLLFYEESAKPPVFEVLGDPGDRPVGIAHLGGYFDLHGPPVPRSEARERLGLTEKRKVFLYAGTVRWSRSPVAFLERFLELSGPDDILLVTGRGTNKLEAEHAHERVRFHSGMVGHDEFRDLICASDFVINDAYRYLGSAIIRVALGYGVPVIARSFGCTADIARGAFIDVPEHPQGLDEALAMALGLSDAEHEEMSRQALERDRERPWSAYGRGCLDLYRRALRARQGVPT